ncbi:hypothetical protein [Amorphus sp. MBR-141]
MTTLRRHGPAGSTPFAAAPTRGHGGATSSRRPLRLVAIGDTLGADVALVAGSRGAVHVPATGTGVRPLLAALAAIARADLVLVAEDARGPLAWVAGHLKSPDRRVAIGARTGAHAAARDAYYSAIARALIRVDREGLFSYTDRAKLAAAGHAVVAH